MRHAPLFGLLLVVAACAAPGPAARPAPAAPLPAAPEPRADGRLPPLATPLAYRLALDVDPSQARFSGKVEIDVRIGAPTAHVVLHGRALRVTRATLRSGAAVLAARASSRTAAGGKAPEELVLSFDRLAPAGPATLALEWDAAFDDELSGLYRVKDAERWYAFTQLEATDARRAFPCFDEPAFKVPFDLVVSAPRGQLAVANTPELERRVEGTRTVFRFATTKPLPTYLVALAVGDFDVRPASRASRPPIRLIAPKGTSDAGGLALEATGTLVDALGSFLGVPYPYEKLDIVAVPEFGAGAMENPGLVTFRKELLLLDPKSASVRLRRAQALTIAHELAHQWFGNLVTAAWWDDLWLNEGMATWMEARIVEAWQPAWGARVDAIAGGLSVMDLDALASARAVRQPVVSTSDAHEAFDGLTYQKGAAVMATIERWIGEDAFKRGVRDYLQKNAWKSVHADALLSSLDRASGKEVSRMASTFLDRPGVPVVSAQLACERGARWNVELSPEPWRPIGSKVELDPNRSWLIPVCVKVQGEKQPACTELVEGAPSVVAGRGCPAWIHPNAGAAYYRFDLAKADLARLAARRSELDVAERVSLLSNAWASVRAGKLEAHALLEVLAAFDDDPARHVTDQIVGILAGASDALVLDDARPAFRSLVAARLGKRKKALGWAPGKDEGASGDDAMLRRSVLWAMGELAEDDATLREAEELAARWLADPAGVDPDAAAVALDLGTRRAGEARLAELRAFASKARNDEHRIMALRAMASFDDPALLERALDVVLTGEIKVSDVRYVLGSALSRRRSRPVAERWVRARWPELRRKLPGSLSSGLVRAAGALCTRAEVEESTAFYRPRAAEIEGAERLLAESLEAAALCAELRASGAARLTRALTRAGAR